MAEIDTGAGIGTNWGWLIIILLFFMTFSGGFGGIFGKGEAAAAVNLTNLERDVLKGQATTDNEILATSCATQKEVFQNRYDNALGVQILGSKMAECCCDMKTAIHADGEATRTLIQENTIQGLRDQIVNLNAAYTNLKLANDIVSQVRPFPMPAYVTCSPYTSISGYNTGCNGIV